MASSTLPAKYHRGTPSQTRFWSSVHFTPWQPIAEQDSKVAWSMVSLIAPSSCRDQAFTVGTTSIFWVHFTHQCPSVTWVLDVMMPSRRGPMVSSSGLPSCS